MYTNVVHNHKHNIYIFTKIVCFCVFFDYIAVLNNDVGYKSIAVYQGILISKVFCIKVGSEALFNDAHIWRCAI